MKALVLSGGSGSRLRPFTHTRSKHLLPLANRPILHHVLDNIAQSGLHDVVILHGLNGQEIQSSVGDGSSWGINVAYVQQDRPLGLAHAVKTARPLLGDEPFVMYLGDNILPGGISPYLKDFYQSKPEAMVLLHPVSNPSAFGIAELDGDHVCRLVEKPTNSPSNLALVGIYFFSPEIHQSIDRIKPSARGEWEITDAIQDLLEHGNRVVARILRESWYDTGTPEDLLKANHDLLLHLTPTIRGQVDTESQIDGLVVIGSGAIVERSHIVGPAIIGDNSRITEAVIGPFTSIADKTSVVRSNIVHSIILGGCKIQNVNHCADCILGEGTVIIGDSKEFKSLRIRCGDHAQIIVPG